MPDFYEVTLHALAGDEDIVNILYYQVWPQATAPFLPNVMGELADAVATLVLPKIAEGVHESCVWDEVRVRIINEQHEHTDPYPIIFPVSVTGSGATGVPSRAACAIAAFNLVPYPDQGSDRLPKRSYLALGPILESQIDDDGRLLWTAQYKTELQAALSSTLSGNTEDYAPVRVGVPNAQGVPSRGRVAAAVVRPFISFRRSRLTRQRGS